MQYFHKHRYKNKVTKAIIFSIFLIAIVSALISASSAAMHEPKEKIDFGKKTIKINNEKYNIEWETYKVMDKYEIMSKNRLISKKYVAKLRNHRLRDNAKRYVYITYTPTKNKKNNKYLDITLEKTSENKMNIIEYSSVMKLGTNKTIKTKISTYNYYWKELRPNISKITKNSILNKVTIRYDENRYFNRTIIDPTTNETITTPYEMNWKVYYYSKTSSIEISERYNELNNLSKNPYMILNVSSQDIRIDKYTKEKLKITIRPYNTHIICGPSTYYEYVKTKLSPKQYYLKVYKNKLKTKNLN